MTWNPAKDGTKRTADLPPFWPNQDGARPENGVCGIVTEWSSYRVKDSETGVEKIVPSLILSDVIEYTPATANDHETIAQLDEVTVTISAGLKHLLATRKTAIGAVISIVYKGIDPSQRSMKVFEVFDHSALYHSNLKNAARMTARRGARG
jgi:hypothetical protein